MKETSKKFLYGTAIQCLRTSPRGNAVKMMVSIELVEKVREPNRVVFCLLYMIGITYHIQQGPHFCSPAASYMMSSHNIPTKNVKTYHH